MVGGKREGSTAPGAASAARAGVRIILLGDPPSFDEDDSDPHCCVKPPDAVTLPSRAATAACRIRHGPTASCSAPMVSRLRWSLDRTARDASLATATTSHATTVPASMRDAFSVPSCPANVPEVSRDRRLPCLMSTSLASGRMAHRVRSAPAARRASAMAHPCPRGCISRRSSTILAYRATALRHLGVAIHTLCLVRPHRISTGCLVSQSVGMAPDHAATGRLPHGRYDSASTKAAPQKCSYHPWRDCAKGRLSAPSLPDCPIGRHAEQGAFGRFRPPAGSDGALRTLHLKLPSRRTPPRRGSSLVGAGHRDVWRSPGSPHAGSTGPGAPRPGCRAPACRVYLHRSQKIAGALRRQAVYLVAGTGAKM